MDNFSDPQAPLRIAYMDLAGGLNTKRDPHALLRNQLAASINGWQPSTHVYGKRPGNSPFVTGSGVTGAVSPTTSMVGSRFNNITQVIQQNASYLQYANSTSAAWTSLGSVMSNGILRGAQLYDPTGTAIPAPIAASLSQTVAGAITGTTYFVKVTLVDAAGETTASVEASLAVSANNVLVVASPAPAGDATGWNVYVSTTTNTETRQNGSTPIAFGTSWTEPTTGLVAGTALPGGNTSLASGNALFLVDGVDVPMVWYGPGTLPLALNSANLPLNHSGSAAIIPAFACTALSSMVYAGEKSEPCGVYISNPFTPQIFTLPNLPGATYSPYLVGHNDGVSGGDITGLTFRNNTIYVYKQSAIYAMTQGVQLYGASLWSVACISSSTGCTAPRSLVSFDTFDVFLGIDGLYTNDGTNVIKISENVPTLFDGPMAQILDRTSAVGGRYQNKYLIFYDNGGL